MATKKRRVSITGVKDDCHLPPLSRREIAFGVRVPIHIHVLTVGHLSDHLHAALRGVNLCVPIPAVTKPRPRGVDDNHDMYLIFRDAHHVLVVGVVVISVHRIVTY